MQSAVNLPEDPLLNKTHYSGSLIVDSVSVPGMDSLVLFHREVVTTLEEFKNLAIVLSNFCGNVRYHDCGSLEM